MSWQERGRDINDALSVLKKAQGKIGERGGRSHGETRESRAVEIVVMERGVCRECQSLIIEVARRRGMKSGVVLECESGENPVRLHLESLYQPDLTPSCPSLVPFKQEEESLTA